MTRKRVMQVVAVFKFKDFHDQEISKVLKDVCEAAEFAYVKYGSVKVHYEFDGISGGEIRVFADGETIKNKPKRGEPGFVDRGV